MGMGLQIETTHPTSIRPLRGRKRAIATYQLITYEQHRQDGSGAHCSRLGHDVTTRLRAKQHRQRAGKKSAPLGILKIPDNNFDAAFEEICASWLDNGLAGWPSSLLNFVHLFGHLFRRRRSYL